MFSKTNDDKRYHLYKLPSSNHSLHEPLVNQLVGDGGGSEMGLGGGLVFTAFCSPLLAVSNQAVLLKMQETTELQGFLLSSFTSQPSQASK